MQLPRNEVGISDILAYRECPQRFAYGMRRHVDLPDRFAVFEGERDEGQESETYPTAYGSAVHDAIQFLEENPGATNDEAIDHAWPQYQSWLEPDDQERMSNDLDTYRRRTVLGYRLVGAELEIRTPLFRLDDGTVIYFRGRIDSLYQHMQNGAVFLSRDYKSSRWPKSEKDVHNDLQQWSYNWLIHEVYPECTDLTQIYDQLRYGEIPTRKTPHQREQIKQWLIRQVKSILSDDALKPRQNEWCPYCPLVLDCRVTHLSADFWKNRLAAIAPEKKVSRKIVVGLTEEHTGLEIYTELLPKIKTSMKTMERFVKAVEGVLKELPQDRRDALGFTLSNPRRIDTWGPSELRAAHELVGDDLFQLVSLSKASLERFYGDDEDSPRAAIEGLAYKVESAPWVKKK